MAHEFKIVYGVIILLMLRGVDDSCMRKCRREALCELSVRKRKKAPLEKYAERAGRRCECVNGFCLLSWSADGGIH
jgi:hypothetical protein